MPSINLRLTDEQHAELTQAATHENRSLQREIIYRLFGTSNHVEAEPPALDRLNVEADSQARDVSARTIEVSPPADHFRPDPKPERKKK